MVLPSLFVCSFVECPKLQIMLQFQENEHYSKSFFFIFHSYNERRVVNKFVCQEWRAKWWRGVGAKWTSAATFEKCLALISNSFEPENATFKDADRCVCVCVYALFSCLRNISAAIKSCFERVYVEGPRQETHPEHTQHCWAFTLFVPKRSRKKNSQTHTHTAKSHKQLFISSISICMVL